MNYLKLFKSKNQYIDTSTNLPDTTIAVCEDGNIIYKDDNKYIYALYNITDISEPTTLFKFASNTQIGTFVYSVEVDGNAVELQASTNFTFDYQFTTTGEHLAKIYLKRTWQGDIFSINFNSNTNIIASRIPKQITTMQSTFYHCTNLTDIIIDYDSMLPDTGMQTYEGCTSLKNIIYVMLHGFPSSSVDAI